MKAERYLTELLRRTEDAHHQFVQLHGPDANWQEWYATHIINAMTRHGLVFKVGQRAGLAMAYEASHASVERRLVAEAAD